MSVATGGASGKGELSTDKVAAYQTLVECLVGVIKMMAPIAPFVSDELYRRLIEGTHIEDHASVHLAPMITPGKERIDPELERRMEVGPAGCFSSAFDAIPQQP